jgi:hypothetical protein
MPNLKVRKSKLILLTLKSVYFGQQYCPYGHSNHIDYLRRLLVLARDFRSCSPFIQTGLQNRGLYGAYVKKRVVHFLAVPT